MSTLEKRTIDWGRNPVFTASNIDYNFDQLFSAFNDLANGKLSNVDISRLNSGFIASGSTDLSELFLSRRSDKVVAGKNIITATGQTGLMISVSPSASFEYIYSGDTNLSDIFISKKDIHDTTRPILGRNLAYIDGKQGAVLDIVWNPYVQFLSADELSAKTAQFDSIMYRGRQLEELLPSYQLPEGVQNLVLKPLNGRNNPNVMLQDMNHNFDSISRAFNTLLQNELDDVRISTVRAERIFYGDSALSDLFLAKDANYDVVRLQAGVNIVTGGTQNRPIIEVTETPLFKTVSADTAVVTDIILNGKNILDVLYTRKEAASLSHPALGNNLLRGKDSSIHVTERPSFESVVTDVLSAGTLSFNKATFNGLPLESQFGSHTHVSVGKNLMSAGTLNDPFLSVVDDPSFVSITAKNAVLNELTGDTVTMNKANALGLIVQDEFRVGEAIYAEKDRVTLANDLHLHDGRVTIGGQPENNISMFLRTKFRLLATESSPIHYAMIVQKKEQEAKRSLNDSTVDFAIRGDGNVGIGVFSDITSKLTIKGEKGHDQLRLTTPFSPSSSTDPNGNIGDLSWDDDFVYIRTSKGWKRSGLEGF